MATGLQEIDDDFIRKPIRKSGMKFNIKTNGQVIDVFVIEQALIQIDPSAIIDIDPAKAFLRVSSILDDSELSSLMIQLGFPVSKSDFQGLPSECCGGCGG